MTVRAVGPRTVVTVHGSRSPRFTAYRLDAPTRLVVELIYRILKPSRPFAYWMDDEEFYREGVRAPRSSCVLDVSKLVGAGVKMRSVKDALEDSLERWQPAVPNERKVRTREAMSEVR